VTVEIKICGINDASGLAAAVEARADWVGFVFFPPSPRFVTAAQAAALAARLPDWLSRVGLFVEPNEAEIAAALAEMRLDALQVYDAPEKAARLRARFGLPVWRPVGIGTQADLPTAAAGADRLVLEARAPAGASRPGGNAARFDWSLARDWTPPAPWMLAGGLTPDNVSQAIRAAEATAVDVSSGVERKRGVKDPALIRAFVTAVRNSCPP
jgi:phosphoribosylanthranilate isomerase